MKEIRIGFRITQKLADKVDIAVENWGFTTRAEFFRFCAISFLQNEGGAAPSEEVIRNYTKQMHSVKASRHLARRDY